MSETSEVVQEFRDVVDRYIDAQVSKAEKRHTAWRGMSKEAEANGAIYTSLEQSDGRFDMFPFSSEHVWGVAPKGKLRLRSMGRLASFAVVSIANEPDTLTRRWSIDSAMQMISLQTQRPLSEDQARAAVVWATNPYLAEREFAQIAIITDEEIESVTPELLRIGESARETQEALERMERDRARAWAEHKDDVIF